MIANEETGQTPAKFDNVIENIFKVIVFSQRKKIFFATYDTTQLVPIRILPFPVPLCVIPCFISLGVDRKSVV